MIGLLDLAFFMVLILLTFGAFYFHYVTAMHGVRRNGHVGATYWGTYGEPEEKPEAKPALEAQRPPNTIALIKPSDKETTSISGAKPTGS
jgi:hypothetical protein